MVRRITDIVKHSDSLFLIEVNKPDKHNMKTWSYKMVDPRWKGGPIDKFNFRTVHLKYDNGYFIAYKTTDPRYQFVYFVDPKKAMFRKTPNSYVNGLVEYSVKSNDISVMKNDSSFRVPQYEMRKNKIYNFLELCHYYQDYTAIGTGYTRDIRNLLVLDIDVDCTKPDNKEALDGILLKFAKHHSLPDFYIFNNISKHVQLQWLIQNLQYKEIDIDAVNKLKQELMTLPNNKVIDYKNYNFTKIGQVGINYRRFTMAMCNIVNKRKFGDKNYTFWKAKNPMSALYGKCDLKLKMPQFNGKEIYYLSQEQMEELFSTYEARTQYFQEAPDMEEIRKRTIDFMENLYDKITEKKVMKIEDDEEISEKKEEKKKNELPSDESRNNFVLKCSIDTTFKVSKSKGFESSEDIRKLPYDELEKFRKEIYCLVKKQFKEKDKQYNGIWPGTTNRSRYSKAEFDSTFASGFNFGVDKYVKTEYTKDDRVNSLRSRKCKKNRKLLIVYNLLNDGIQRSRNELQREVNRLYKKEIPLGTLKRLIQNAKKLTNEEVIEIQKSTQAELRERERQLNEAIKLGKSKERINTLKSRIDYLGC